MDKYDITIEGEGYAGTVDAASEADAIERAEDLIATGDYDLATGESYTVRYWLTPVGDAQGDSRELVLEG